MAAVLLPGTASHSSIGLCLRRRVVFLECLPAHPPLSVKSCSIYVSRAGSGAEQGVVALVAFTVEGWSESLLKLCPRGQLCP